MKALLTVVVLLTVVLASGCSRESSPAPGGPPASGQPGDSTPSVSSRSGEDARSAGELGGFDAREREYEGLLAGAGANPLDRGRTDSESPLGAAAASDAENTESEFARGGPLARDWEYVLCLRERDKPLSAVAILRNRKGRIVPVAIVARYISHEEFEQAFFAHSADDDEFVYWLRPGAGFHRMPRVRAGDPVAVPAVVLVRFVGDVSRLPVIAEARSGFAERSVAVPPDTTDLGASHVRQLLGASGMPLTDLDLGNDRPALSWAMPGEPARAPPRRATETLSALFTPSSKRPLSQQGVTINIDAGEIPLTEFLRFLADFTALPVCVDADRASLAERDMFLVSPIEDVDEAILTALFWANGILVGDTTLDDGRAALVVTLPSH